VKNFLPPFIFPFVLGIAVSGLCGCTSWNKSDRNSRWSLGQVLGTDADASAASQDAVDEDFDVFGERNPDRLQWSDLGPGRIGTTLQARFGGGQDRQAAEAAFREGRRIYDQALESWNEGQRTDELRQQFREASSKFEIAAAKWTGSALEQDALFLQGESSFFADDYVLANRAYEILLNKYSGTRQLDLVEARRFEIARYWLSMENSGEGWDFNNPARPGTGLAKEARRILHRIRLDDPTGKLADDATLALGNAFFEAGLYADAADAYEDLRRTYPGSAHQFHAHLFELKARLAAYRGPDYDGTDLQKAEQLMKALVRQFPREVEAEREYLAREGSRIRELMAERDWTMARYYEKRGENRAARFYYAKITGEFDDTTLASRAEERIAALGGEPDVPAQVAPWLADLFPVKERNRPLLTPGDRDSILR
jgi:outer membrane protein assembly factor BamD (BamD/ComL family)